MKKTEWSAEAVALTLDIFSGGSVLDMWHLNALMDDLESCL